jgi:uncharacterized membrane protein
MTGHRLAWPGGMIGAAILVGLGAFVLPNSPLRPWLVVPFLLVCPGMVLVHRLRLDEWWVELLLAVGISIAVDTLLATAMVYAGVWSPKLLLGVLVWLSLIAGIEELIRRLAT